MDFMLWADYWLTDQPELRRTTQPSTMGGPLCDPGFCILRSTVITTGGTPHLCNRGSSMRVNSLHSGQIICNFSTLPILIVYRFPSFKHSNWLLFRKQNICVNLQNILMINEKNTFLTVSWLSGLLFVEIFISTGEWGVQMPPLAAENSHFLWSGA